MLKLKNISKYYKISKSRGIILDDITIDFKNNELVFILGPSGSGKSTLLNIIGGNLKPDGGEIWLDDLRVSKLNEHKLDAYRANVIGNIFQDYNLIDYMNVWDNIMIGGNNSEENINILLKQLGIYDKKTMVVSKLSGGEKQRVAIARALVNNPKIVLADEPTGALDKQNGLEVMDILKRISRQRLVIVVSHDVNLANLYADRIIHINDGRCEYVPINGEKCIYTLNRRKYRLSKTLKLAFKNLWLKKLRTLVTAVAVSLGVITMFMVINMYNNFNKELSNLEKDIVSVMPIMIKNGEYDINNEELHDDNEIIIKNKDSYVYNNYIDDKYLSYLNNIKEISYMTYDYDISMPLISDNYREIDVKYFVQVPSNEYITDNYDLIYGHNIGSKFDLLLKVDSNNIVNSELLNYFGFDNSIAYQDIVGRKIKIILNDDYYLENNDYYVINNSIDEMYNNSDIELTIVGIVKEKEIIDGNSYLYYDKDIINMILDINRNSNIVMSQINNDYNVLGLHLNKNEMLSFLGHNTIPIGINIYADSILNKEKIIKQLDDYNLNNKKVIYVDTMEETINIVKQFVMIISIILIIFSVIAIIISSLMIGILTNIRVLERRKEIGILKSLGYGRKNIKRIFNSENIIIGLIAIIISFIIIQVITEPLNMIMDRMIKINDIFNVNYYVMLLVFIINLIIIKIAGSIPARRASKMDAVTCIYNR